MRCCLGLCLLAEGSVRVITYKQWAQMITSNFENHFWISRTKTENEVNSHLINRRGIYKDTAGSSISPWTDYQLRPNFPIAIAVVRFLAQFRFYSAHKKCTFLSLKNTYHQSSVTH